MYVSDTLAAEISHHYASDHASDHAISRSRASFALFVNASGVIRLFVIVAAVAAVHRREPDQSATEYA
jgi:hypothetical protein